METTLITHFWRWFEQYQAATITVSPETNAIDHFWSTECRLHLETIDAGLDFEIWYQSHKDEHWMIITAGGKPALFPVVDALVEQAPYIKGWTFQALIPPMYNPVERFAEKHDLSEFNPLQYFFCPEDLENPPGGEGFLHLYAHDEGFVDEEDEKVIWDLLYRLVGERAVGSQYAELFVYPINEMPEEYAEYIHPISDLMHYFPDGEMSGFRIDNKGQIKPDNVVKDEDSDG